MPDDLTKIRGIGAAREQWLHDAGIRTYADLAAISADELKARLDAAGRDIPRTLVERWIEDAARLAPPGERAQTSAGAGWKELGEFVIVFEEHEDRGEQRVHVHHMAEDRDATWQGFAGLEPYQWMLEQLGIPPVDVLAEVRAEAMQMVEQTKGEWQTALIERLERLEREFDDLRTQVKERLAETELRPRGAAAPASPPTSQAEPAEEPVTVKQSAVFTIDRLVVEQPPGSSTPVVITGSEAAPVMLQRDAPFSLGITFRVKAADLAGLEDREAPYAVQIRAHDLETNTTRWLVNARSGEITAGQTVYSNTFSDLTLPAGRYRLDVLVVSSALPGMSFPLRSELIVS
jgi:hypothetical protein